MYSPLVTAKALELQMAETPGFKAEYHSLADIGAMTALLEEAYDPQAKRLTRHLTQDEIDFIQNERLICTHDFNYYANYCYIVDFEKKLTRFRPNVAQRIVLDIWGEMDEQRWAIMMLQLKARQLGVSTLTELAVAHRVQFWADVDAVVASSTPTKTEKLSKMIRVAWEHMPWWLMPRTTRWANLMPAEFGELNSALDCSQSGNQFSGVSRGSTPGVAHFSELCEWTNPAEDIDASFLNAVHETPYVFAILESTALGRDNWWHKKWRLSKEGWSRGRSRLCPIFLPWYVGRDIYPDEGWLAKHPVPGRWLPDDWLVNYAKRCEEYVKSEPRIRKMIGDHWVMPREQLWWYEVTREEYRKANELNRFLAECPADSFEAFQSTNQSVFPVEVVTHCRERIKSPIGTYKLIGIGEQREDIPVEHRPTSLETDTSQPRIPIEAKWGPHSLAYELVPVKFEGYEAATQGIIFVWEHPIPTQEYGFGFDTGDGIGLDSSGFECIRKGTLTENDRQVCEFNSPYINAMSLWPWGYALGSYYATTVNGERRQPRVVIDCLKAGEAVQHEMRKRGWWNFHQWMRYDAKKLNLGNNYRIGFYSNQWARTWMLEMVQTYINNSWIDLYSPMFVEEMESLEKDEYKQSARAAHGAHDDRIVMLGMILFSFYVNETRGPRMSTAEQRQASRIEEDPTYDGVADWQRKDLGGVGAAVQNWRTLADMYEKRR